MAPGAWFREMADAACADTALDLGVHLTLTSEWDACRWAPVSTVSRASGLIDDEGYFWRDVASLRRHIVVEAAELEMRAQIERAAAAGMRLTHIDAHMAAAMLPELLDAHVRLAREYGLFPVLPRSIGWAPDVPRYQEAVAALDREGAPVVDHCMGTLAVDADRLEAAWAGQVAAFGEGVTHLALHCTVPGEFSAMAPAHAGWRVREYALLDQGWLEAALSRSGMAMAGTRTLQALWLAAIRAS